MSISTMDKRVNEKFPIGLKYQAPDLEEGDTLASAIVSILPSETNGLEVVGNAVVEEDEVTQTVQKGISGHDYYVTFKVTTTLGNVYEDKILVKVRD